MKQKTVILLLLMISKRSRLKVLIKNRIRKENRSRKRENRNKKENRKERENRNKKICD